MMSENPIGAKLRSRFPEAVAEVTDCAGIPTVRIQAESLPAVCGFLKSDPDLDFDYLSNLCGADYPDREKRFEVVYHIYSIRKGHKFSLLVGAVDKEEVPSVTSIWPAADYPEREAYDLFGIRFSGHPDLKRLFLPDWWDGHPLRKDYPVEGRGEEQKVVDECLRLSKPKS
jgi:NADH-quinone oxidoreductase subunit C